MIKNEFLRWAMLFTAANSKFASIDSFTWTKTIKEKTMALLRLAQDLKLIEDEPDKPP